MNDAPLSHSPVLEKTVSFSFSIILCLLSLFPSKSFLLSSLLCSVFLQSVNNMIPQHLHTTLFFFVSLSVLVSSLQGPLDTDFALLRDGLKLLCSVNNEGKFGSCCKSTPIDDWHVSHTHPSSCYYNQVFYEENTLLGASITFLFVYHFNSFVTLSLSLQ